jgi:hypothetical protein
MSDEVRFEWGGAGIGRAALAGIQAHEVLEALRSPLRYVAQPSATLTLVAGLAESTGRVIVVTMIKRASISPVWWITDVRVLRDDEYEQWERSVS